MKMPPWSLAHEPLTILVVVLAGCVGIFAKKRFGPYPDLPIYLFFGILIGPVLHLVSLSLSGTVSNILILGAVLILYEGGRGLAPNILREVIGSVARLAIIGWMITAAVITLAAHFLFHVPWGLASLLAIVVANTDPATVIPIMSELAIREEIKTTMEAESAFNDPVSAVATGIALTLLAKSGASSATIGAAAAAALHIVEGFLIGGLMGVVGHLMGRHADRLGMVSYLVPPLGAYLLASWLGGNVYLAGFVAGIAIGHGGGVPTISEEWRQSVSGLSRIAVFVFLGASFPLSVIPAHWALAVGLTLFLIVVARPLTVYGSLGGLRGRLWHSRELGLMTWVRESGAVSAVLGAQVAERFPASSGTVLAVVFTAILVTVGLQVPTTPYLARRLGLLENSQDPGASD